MWIVIRLAVARLPWHLLKGGEKGPRDRLTREARNDAATDAIFNAVRRYRGAGRPQAPGGGWGYVVGAEKPVKRPDE